MSAFDQPTAQHFCGVGRTTESSVRVWYRSPAPGPKELRIWPSGRPDAAVRGALPSRADDQHDGTLSVEWPGDFAGAQPLAPGTPHEFVLIDAGGASRGEGRFETAPSSAVDGHERFSIALMSCHQPFDDDGNVMPIAERQLAILDSAFERYRVKRVMMLGDQMYTDLPEGRSLFNDRYFRRVAPREAESIFDCSREEVRALFQARYRRFWSLPSWRRILSRYSCYPIMDDHELFDNFGSDPAHAEERWANLREGALDAFVDYQGAFFRPRIVPRPRSLHLSFEYGPVAAFIMDLRSQRHATASGIRIVGQEQLDALAAYLAAESARPLFILGLSIPLVYLPGWAADAAVTLAPNGSDAHDRWDHHMARAGRADLVELLSDHQLRHPHQRLVLASGDIHAGVLSEVVWSKPPLRAYQVISSGVTNVAGVLANKLAELIPWASSAFDLGGERTSVRMELVPTSPSENPYSGLNVGIIEIARARSDKPLLRFRLIGSDDRDPPQPRVMAATAEL
jgi:alkaline phosphatase D